MNRTETIAELERLRQQLVDATMERILEKYPWARRIVDAACRVILEKDAEIERLHTNVRHWREECGKLNAQARASRDWQDRARKAESANYKLGIEAETMRKQRDLAQEELSYLGRGLP